jgi:hypothetical protein
MHGESEYRTAITIMDLSHLAHIDIVVSILQTIGLYYHVCVPANSPLFQSTSSQRTAELRHQQQGLA